MCCRFGSGSGRIGIILSDTSKWIAAAVNGSKNLISVLFLHVQNLGQDPHVDRHRLMLFENQIWIGMEIRFWMGIKTMPIHNTE
jgi:hypothetical protein